MWVRTGAILCQSFLHPRTWSPVIENTDQASTVDNAGPLRLVKAETLSAMRCEVAGKRFRWFDEGSGVLILEVWEAGS